ncbi:hypothetical protein K443DRAFT_656330 [Laccaria amethystina LaAM-08-1]|uniref:Uncharacterized protein n=1 Tax=Laccaria amethystina LaAM-08-1 TaxID=1095629 RepID=A0A0C9WHG7_9AGAR|nr:hypothetical protein K443DRAFT_656330 [Laccaria amethystina LaAM-08-1]
MSSLRHRVYANEHTVPQVMNQRRRGGYSFWCLPSQRQRGAKHLARKGPPSSPKGRLKRRTRLEATSSSTTINSTNSTPII